jgi:dipeptidyl aminopeptidase/acylaminoacyl peptidase
MSLACQRPELCAQEHCNQLKERFRKLFGFARACVLLTSVCYICSGEESRIVASAYQTGTENSATKRPVSAADFIEMARFGDSLYNDGAPSKGRVAKFSPDGKRFVVILRKGNLQTNANDYSLVLFETDEIFRKPNPVVLVSMSSSSNRPAIQNVVWMDDNDTILFLGEQPGETTQIYSFKCSSKELKKLTNHATNLSSFVAAAKGAEIIFTAENPEVPFVNENTARKGINITSELLSDLIAGKYGGGELNDHSLFIKRSGSEEETRITTEGRVGSYNEMSLAPDGLHLVLQTEAMHVPDLWAQYSDEFLKTSGHSASGARTSILQYELVDIKSGTSRLLLDAPIPPSSGSETAWSPDSQSIIVSNMYLPLNIQDAAERAVRETHTFLVELGVSDRQLAKISGQDLRLLDWSSKTNTVECDVGRVDSLTGKTTRKIYFRKSDNTWSISDAPQEQTSAVLSLPNIVLDENMNDPPKIFAVASDGKKTLLMDLNPQFRSLNLAKVEEVSWKASHHSEVKGGLYWPVNYAADKKYPLIIQTHAWNPDRFWIDGPWTTAFAAQALSGKGFFVLQVPDPDFQLVDTPREVPAAMAAYDGAIELLDRRGLIDRDRIGIIGFSRTYMYVTYTLTHSKHHFAAAAVADGVDYGYFQYMAFSNSEQHLAGEWERLNGAAPFGKGLLKWFKVTPEFRMDKIETPLRIQTMGPVSLLGDWHWFSGLYRLGKPVEMVYIPEETHILEKPWERMISQQGDVDWFCFWLKGEEDPDPGKAEQYKRWRSLRALSSKPLPDTLRR